MPNPREVSVQGNQTSLYEALIRTILITLKLSEREEDLNDSWSKYRNKPNALLSITAHRTFMITLLHPIGAAHYLPFGWSLDLLT